jgi:hypothetical protein
MLDPIYSDPSDKQWAAFLGAFNAFNRGLGATFSLSQTKFAPPADVPPIEGARPRFTTKYYAQYVKAQGSKGAAAAAAAAGAAGR